MSTPNPFAAYANPTSTTPPATETPTVHAVPTAAQPGISVPPGMDAAQFAAYQQWQASQAAAASAAVAPPAAPPAAPVAPPAQVVDPGYAAYLAQQASQQATAPSAPTSQAPAAQFVAPPAAPSGGDEFDVEFEDPAPQRAKGPRLEEMYGRLLMIIPKGMDKGKGTDSEGKATEYDRMTADVIVLDGGPIAFGGDPGGRPPIPHDKVENVPLRVTDMYISAKGLISQSSRAWTKAQAKAPGAFVVGRLGVGEKKNPAHQAPWLLTKATDAEKDTVRAYVRAVREADPFASF